MTHFSFFLFFLVLTFHFFPYGTKKGGRGFKPLSLFYTPYEFVSFHALVMGFWSLTCRKFSTRVGVRGYYRHTQKLKFDQVWS